MAATIDSLVMLSSFKALNLGQDGMKPLFINNGIELLNNDDDTNNSCESKREVCMSDEQYYFAGFLSTDHNHEITVKTPCGQVKTWDSGLTRYCTSTTYFLHQSSMSLCFNVTKDGVYITYTPICHFNINK
jgi:hypothetical protein